MDRNNRSYIVLSKKKVDSCTPNVYRPISLLNRPIKLITKTLTLRLQGCLRSLINLDQSGCVCSRSISDSFIFALDLVQTYKLRKKKTVVLKVDFRKAFDTISWDCLLRVLQIRRFNHKWIQLLLESAKTTILLNDIPSP
jgi:hypothetical protein